MRLSLAVWVLSLPASTLAGSPATNDTYDIWPVQHEGMPNAVTSVLQSHAGYVWVGTYQGLLRYDGARFTPYDSTHTPGLQNSRITALYEDREGKLWIGHETGQLTEYADGSFKALNPGPSWPGGAIEAITSDSASDIWLLNNAGTLFRLRDGLPLDCPGGASPSRKAVVSRDNGGRLWVSANGKVARVEDGKLSPVQFPDATPADFYERVGSAPGAAVWVLGNGRVRKWNRDQFELDLDVVPWGSAALTGVLETRAGVLLVGTLNNGLYLLRPGAETLHFCRTNGLSHDWVRSLCEDHEGNVWIGTGGGLDTLRVRKVRMLEPPDHFEGRMVLSTAFQPDGTAWLGTEGAGLYRYDHGHWESYREASGLSNLFVWSVLYSRQGQLYVGTWGGGLSVLKDGHLESPGDLGKVSAPVVSLFESQEGDIWVGTTLGVHRFQGGKLSWSAGKEKLSLPDVRAIAQTRDGTMWFGMSGGGLASLRDGQLRQFRRPEGLPSDFVMCLHADAEGGLWVGTADNGLSYWKDGTFGAIEAEQGLSSQLINQMVEDGLGNLWLGSQRGLLRLNLAELRLCAQGATKTVQCFTYDKAEGMAAPSCSGGFQPSAGLAPDGWLWFPTPKGVATIDPRRVGSNTVPPPVVIEDLLADGKAVSLRSTLSPPNPAQPVPSLEIPPGKQRFELRYTGLSFAAPDKVRFQYRLEGLEKEWREAGDAGTKRSAEYSYLPPGAYTFEVIACNNDGLWNPQPATLEFTVLPHFWQTGWFRTAFILTGAGAIAGLVMGVMHRRQRRKLEHLERQRALEQERARIARDIHDELGASLTRITLLSQSARSDLSDEQAAASHVDQIYTNARELTRAMDEIVWALNPKHDTFDSLVTYLGRFAQHFLSAAGIRCRLDIPLRLPGWALTAEIRHNLFLAFKEALHNVVQHAQATEVRISVELQPEGFVLVVADNGHGFEFNGGPVVQEPAADTLRLAGGNGLLHMQQRLEELGGRCQWDTAPGEGTRVRFAVDLRTSSKQMTPVP